MRRSTVQRATPIPSRPSCRQTLASTVDAEVLGVDPADLGLQLLVTQRPGRGRPAAGGVVGGRGDRQHLADRLDPVTIPVLVDVDDHLVGRRSSSAPKKAAADFRISLARRSSRFSRSSDFSRWRSSLVSPGRRPSSVSARRTHLRRVSAETPNLCAMEVIAAHWEACSSWCSNTSLTARSRSSGGYLPGRVMAPTSHESEPPKIPGRFKGTIPPFAPRIWLNTAFYLHICPQPMRLQHLSSTPAPT